jgi:hypothetical protein
MGSTRAELLVSGGGPMSNSDAVLSDLAREIEENEKSRRACEVKGLMHGMRIGQLLIEAKKVVPHGGFLDWVKGNTSVTPRMCQIYMKVAKNPRLQWAVEHQYETVSHLTLNQAVKLARQPKAREDKARDQMARQIAAKWEASTETRKSFVRCLGEIRVAMADEGSGDDEFKSWLTENGVAREVLAEKIPDLIDRQADDDAWTVAMFADLVAMLEARP